MRREASIPSESRERIERFLLKAAEALGNA
jgi:hypothetical protein